MVDHHQDQKAREKVWRVLGEGMKGREEKSAFRKGWDDHCSSITFPLDSGECPRGCECPGSQVSLYTGINHSPTG